MWRDCPHKWKLNYVDKVASFNDNINFLFGTAMHTVLQEFIKKMYAENINAANELDLYKMLLEKMKGLYNESKLNKDFTEFSSKQEMADFYNDGCRIIDYFKSHRGDYFSKKGYSLIGVEVPLEVPVTDNIMFRGFLDVVIKDDFNGKIKIFDFKTSGWGWRAAVKKSETKTAQLVLYKHYFAKQYDIPVENIDVMFIILKRKLYERSEFPQKRFQKVEPPSGKITIKKVAAGFDHFVTECFDKSGKPFKKAHLKKPSKKNCQYCEFKDLPKYCDRKA